MSRLTHLCNAESCLQRVPARMLMCRAHWRMVPRKIQRLVWAYYREGQELDLDLSEAYMAARALAIASVARREGNPEEVANRCEEARKQAARCGVPVRRRLLEALAEIADG